MNNINELLEFLNNSPTAFHATENISKILEENGFRRLYEEEQYNLEFSKKYYVTRNNSSIIAFKTPESKADLSVQIVSSHSDSPSFKLKENFEIDNGKYMKINTEGYGGMICPTWMDRRLSIAGRVMVKLDGRIKQQLINVDKNLLVIPNVAIHFNRTVNDGMAYNKQVDMIPIAGLTDQKKDVLKDFLADSLNVKSDEILSYDLFLYNRDKAEITGLKDEMITSGRIDNLECAFATLQGFLKGNHDNNLSIYCCFDNEEVGSGTKQGALSTFFDDTLNRIAISLGLSEEEKYRAFAKGFMISADNAHAVHPNHPEKSDQTNAPYMNEGIVIKVNANQKYTSDSYSIAVFKEICNRANVAVQMFANRSDVMGGSTLGNLLMTRISFNTVDIGLSQLGMHSALETCGVKDYFYLKDVITTFFDSHISCAFNEINIE